MRPTDAPSDLFARPMRNISRKTSPSHWNGSILDVPKADLSCLQAPQAPELPHLRRDGRRESSRRQDFGSPKMLTFRQQQIKRLVFAGTYLAFLLPFRVRELPQNLTFTRFMPPSWWMWQLPKSLTFNPSRITSLSISHCFYAIFTRTARFHRYTQAAAKSPCPVTPHLWRCGSPKIRARYQARTSRKLSP